MGDNGFMWGEHGLIDKRVSYEASIRVPMIMQCPDLFEGGAVVENKFWHRRHGQCGKYRS